MCLHNIDSNKYLSNKRYKEEKLYKLLVIPVNLNYKK